MVVLAKFLFAPKGSEHFNVELSFRLNKEQVIESRRLHLSLLVSQLRPRDYSLFTKRNVFSYSLLLIPYFLMWSYSIATLGIGFQPKLLTDNPRPNINNRQPIIIYFYLLMFYSIRQPTTKYQQPTTNHYLFLFIDILFHKTTHDQIPTTDNRTFIY